MRCCLLVCILEVCAFVAVGGEMRRYEVKPGDTLCRIAWHELGDVERWREIARLNDMQDDTLREGQIILLPPAAPRQQPSLTSPRSVEKDGPAPTASPATPPDQAPLLSAASGETEIWWPALIALGTMWVFLAISLRAACWFALVETSFRRCAMLAAAIALVSAFALAGAAAVDNNAFAAGAFSGRAILRCSGILALYFLIGAGLTRWLLGCRWRSVVTIYIMSLVVAGIFAIGGWHGLAAAEAAGKISPAWRTHLRQVPAAVQTESYKALTACGIARPSPRR